MLDFDIFQTGSSYVIKTHQSRFQYLEGSKDETCRNSATKTKEICEESCDHQARAVSCRCGSQVDGLNTDLLSYDDFTSCELGIVYLECNYEYTDEAKKFLNDCEKNCHSPCERVELEHNINMLNIPDHHLPKIRDMTGEDNITLNEILVLSVQFSTLREHTQTAVVSTGLFDLVGSLGGNLGIWCGISIMTMMELLEYFAAASVLFLIWLKQLVYKGKYDDDNDIADLKGGAITLGMVEQSIFSSIVSRPVSQGQHDEVKTLDDANQKESTEVELQNINTTVHNSNNNSGSSDNQNDKKSDSKPVNETPSRYNLRPRTRNHTSGS